MLGLASSAGSCALSAASSYMWRQDASTSQVPMTDDGAGSGSGSNRSTAAATDDGGHQKVVRPHHKRTASQLPSASPPRHHHPQHRHHHAAHSRRTPSTTTTAAANGSQRTPTGAAASSPSRSRKTSASYHHGHAPNGATHRHSTGPTSSSFQSGGCSPSHPTSAQTKDTKDAIALVKLINETEDLYQILGVNKKAKSEEIRRAFLGRSRICHPDKLPDFAAATPAFQRLSYAYETLSKPASRRIYDLGGGRSFDQATPKDGSAGLGDETLNGVLRSVFTEFLNGDFEMIRVFVNALNEGNPGLNLGDETVDSLEGAFRRVREVLLSGQKYMRLIRFELIRLYQIQSNLRALSYFDILGRLRLTLALTRVTLEIPMVLDKAMREEVVVHPNPSSNSSHTRASSRGSSSSDSEGGGPSAASDMDDDSDPNFSAAAGELQRRGLLGPRVKGVLVLACKVLEKGEKWGT
ncbi:hypothetical protein OIV83_005510 [Microbotryomycetes sp. JL201]|nr:hypothetical protein OIV83_005510 [Microbotryomycetes sp. JL201]